MEPRTRTRLIAAVALVAAAAAAATALWPRSARIDVRPGDDLQSALDRAPAGATVTLAAGTHVGPALVGKPLALVGEPGAVLTAPPDTTGALVVTAPDATVEGLALQGGSSGVVVRAVDRVRLTDLTVTGAEFHGIEVVDASAHISGVSVAGLLSPFAQGIEIRNSDGRPDTVVEDSSVRGGQEGIVAHVSEVVFENNRVESTTMRALAVTEMSDGVVTGNRVRDAAGVGLYCGDMSRCAFRDNLVGPVAAGEGGRSNAGWGLLVNYHASASDEGNALEGAAGETATMVSSRLLADSPLELGLGWAALLPASVATAAAAALLFGAFFLSTRVIAPRLDPATNPASNGGQTWPVWIALALGLGIQGFHMVEHGLQVYRVHFDGLPSRGGIVGPVVEAEWIHFIYNTLVFAMIGAVALVRRGGWRRQEWRDGRRRLADAFLGASLLVQGYHVVEHSVKLTEHLITGHKVNDGLLGTQLDLVWLHFTLNLAVYAAFVAACVLYAPPLRSLTARFGAPRVRAGAPGGA